MFTLFSGARGLPKRIPGSWGPISTSTKMKAMTRHVALTFEVGLPRNLQLGKLPHELCLASCAHDSGFMAGSILAGPSRLPCAKRSLQSRRMMRLLPPWRLLLQCRSLQPCSQTSSRRCLLWTLWPLLTKAASRQSNTWFLPSSTA